MVSPVMYKDISTRRIRAHLVDLPQKTSQWLIRFDVAAGYLSSPAKPEMPHLLEHYLVRCLKKVGLDCWAATDADDISFYIDLSEKKHPVRKLTSFLSSLLNNPLDDLATFTLESKIWQNEHLGVLDDPETIARRVAINHLTANRPYATKPTEISWPEMQSFHTDHFLTSAMHLFIGVNRSDGMSTAEIAQVLRPYDDLLVRSFKQKTEFLAAKRVPHKIDTNRTYLCLAWPAPTQGGDSVEQIGISLIADLLGDPTDGVLWDALQDKTGLIYELDYWVDYWATFGYFAIQAATLDGDAPNFIQIVKSQISNLKQGKILRSKLKKLIRQHIATSKRLWRENESRLKWVASDLKYRDKVYGLDDWLALYQTITPAGLSSLVKKYLTKNLQIVEAGKNRSSSLR